MIEVILVAFLIAVIGIALLVSIANQTQTIGSGPISSLAFDNNLGDAFGSSVTLRTGTCFTVTSAWISTSVMFQLAKSMSPTGTLSANLFTATGGFPCSINSANSPFTTSTNTINIASLTTSFVLYTFTFSNPTITPGAYIVDLLLGTPGGTGSYLVSANSKTDPTQSYVDSSACPASCMGHPFHPAVETPCTILADCVGYTLNGNLITPSGLQATTSALEIFAVGILVIFLARRIEEF